jgi:Na+/melibiose symporter-like transporter
MIENMQDDNTERDVLNTWTKIGIASGLVACFVYPILILVSLPRIPQVVLGASFGPALAVASVALRHILEVRHRTPSLELAAISNTLAGALVTAEITVQLAINYSTAPADEAELANLLRGRLWDIVLGLDVSFDVFIGLATLLFALNMMGDLRFGKIIGWAGVLVSIVMLFGANIYYFPDPPYAHGFPHVGLFTGLWYLLVVLMLVRSLRKSPYVASPTRNASQ